LRHQEHGAAGVFDPDEGVRREFAVGRVLRLLRLVDGGAERQMEGEQEAGGETAGQNRTAGDVRKSLVGDHGGPHD
jgi:hypothetical protein